MAELVVLAGLRRLDEIVVREVQKMPIVVNVRNNAMIGPMIDEALAEGYAKGQITTLLRQLEARFGPLPSGIQDRLQAKSATELEDLSTRLLDAKSLAELF